MSRGSKRSGSAKSGGGSSGRSTGRSTGRSSGGRVAGRKYSQDLTAHQLKVIGLVAILTFMIVALILCFVAMLSLNSRAAELKSELAELERLKVSQKSELDRKGESEYIKKYARENLGLQEEGEERFAPE